MEDKRTLLATFLIISFVMVYTQVVFAPHPQPSQQGVIENHQPEVGQPVPQNQSVTQVQGSNQTQVTTPLASTRPSLEAIKSAAQTIIESESITVTITHLGARIESLKLKNYRLQLKDTRPYEVVSAVEGSPLPLAVYAENVNDDQVIYKLEPGSPVADGVVSVAPNQEVTLTFAGVLPNGNGIKKIFRFRPASFLFDVTIQLSRPTTDGSPVWLDWTHYVSQADLDAGTNPRKFTSFDAASKLKNTMARQSAQGLTDLGASRWIAFDDYYFIEALIPSDGPTPARSVRAGELFSIQSSGTPSGGSFKVFAGAKATDQLSAAGFDLSRSVDLGIFAVLAEPILVALKFFNSILGNWGLSIIFLTLLIKIGFLPLTKASFKSMKAMQDLQPEIKALRERVQDPNQLNQEMMALYKKRGVNPLGGCIPILIQIPVFFGLYNALLNSIELRHSPFALWITDLSAPESLHIFGIGVPLMIIIMGLSMILQQWMTPSAMDETQRKTMLLMPIVFTVLFIIHPMPSGLVLYWLVNNIISIIQQAYLRSERRAGPFTATIYASFAMFGLGYLLTLL